MDSYYGDNCIVIWRLLKMHYCWKLISNYRQSCSGATRKCSQGVEVLDLVSVCILFELTATQCQAWSAQVALVLQKWLDISKTVFANCCCTYIWASMSEQLHPAQGLPHLLFVCLQESKFSVSCPTSLGKLVLIEVDKKPLPLFPEDAWFPCKFKVKSPEGDIYNFPIYRWISDTEVNIFREGTGLWSCTCLLHYFQTSQILIL